ncbi:MULTISPECIES: aminotransferase class I/II-fold pyridoxal phosphate-dependent enzyme [unclassified Pseudomonas]|uniref:pyridoxal phosphate-dependent aminotransferase n=1 Tax=unclassified Pseudomonas TaxID=196821 RepID=UPI00244C94A9|nr:MULTISPECIES: aminotransferase class I/II-fold pyridoxal phosphate-dependent enzyme [unclassified Pseudomonas]MDH0301790.1 aminotransferase class I/II-fold pyridoxal phosphate-dependent enzyme [Pseudomonas sp. GD04091]MDH1983922.1 aminotransferase class I/II-fold pyridoxal phosphate-dependent enzyme [Pseudomonas sp. GD03689]
MRYSSLTQRIAGDAASAWDIHYQALAMRRQGREVFLLSVGDPDFDTPAPVVEAAVASLRRGDTHYSDVRGSLALREAIVRRSGLAVEPDQVVVMAGAQCALFATCQCLFEAGDEVIVAEPMYVTYHAVLGACGARAVPVATRAEEGFRLDPDAVARAVSARTRGLLLNTPHNPTGAVVDAPDLQRLATLCRAHDLWLLCDEVYRGLSYDREAPLPLQLPGMAERCVVIDSLSKSHAMSGWRVGWVIGPPALAGHLGNLAMAMLFGLPEFVMHAACVALEQALPEVGQMREAYRQRRDRVCAVLEGCLGVRAHRPAGGMFVMLDIRRTGLGAQAFAQRLLDEEGVALLPGDAFGPSAAGHVRLGLVLEVEVLEKVCRRIAAFAMRLSAEQASGDVDGEAQDRRVEHETYQ